jgi:Na+/H+-translocating membrane pyrophosphatase
MTYTQKVYIGAGVIGALIIGATALKIAEDDPRQFSQTPALPVMGDLVHDTRGQSYVVHECYGPATCLVYDRGQLKIKQVVK